MGTEGTRSDSAQEAPNKVGRRSVLKFFGLGAVGLAPLPIIPSFLGSVLTPGRGPMRDDYNPALAPNGRVRKWTMIIDLRNCDGCQSVGKPPQCTTACIEGHFVPEPMQWIEVFEAKLPGEGTQFIPTPCQQCQNPPCTNVCPVGATFGTPEGSILIDQDRCIGCRICMAACPYDRRFFNWGEAPVPPEAHLAHYQIEHQTPAKKGTVMKCDFCPDMARAGTLPYCVQGCPHKAIYYGDLEQDIATNGEQVVSVSRFLSEHQAYNLKEELGTKPRVYYIPGHGELVGRDSSKKGRLATTWPWATRAKGAKTWKR
jgi:molybdopterin-containing oxidoreductase family iron-sulfur binding subunit